MSKEKRKCDKTNDSGEPSSSKLKKRPTKVNTSWFKEFDCLAKSDKGDSFVQCTLCESDVSISAGGKFAGWQSKVSSTEQDHEICCRPSTFKC